MPPSIVNIKLISRLEGGTRDVAFRNGVNTSRRQSVYSRLDAPRTKKRWHRKIRGKSLGAWQGVRRGGRAGARKRKDNARGRDRRARERALASRHSALIIPDASTRKDATTLVGVQPTVQPLRELRGEVTNFRKDENGTRGLHRRSSHASVMEFLR
jgi:hypothetical protein